MKIRNGFVSNSSSSSFLVTGKQPKQVDFVELKKDQIEAIVKAGEVEKFKWDGKEPVYLTQFISDCGGYEEFEEDKKCKKYNFCNGGHGGPYVEEEFEEVISNVWLEKRFIKTKVHNFRITENCMICKKADKTNCVHKCSLDKALMISQVRVCDSFESVTEDIYED